MQSAAQGNGAREKRIPALGIDLAISAIIFALALVLRLYNFMVVPALTDETREMIWALRITQGAHLPLTSVITYIGPPFEYIAALAFRIFGVSIELPRLLVVLLGALTVLATFWLARSLAGPLAGTIAALLLAFSGVHIAINSHIAWTNATTPFFTTLALIPFVLAAQNKNPRYLPLGGFLFGLALQTHPTVLALGAGLGVWFVWNPVTRAFLRTRWFYLMLASALIGYGNMLAYDVAEFNTANNALASATRRTYAFSLVTGLDEYASRLLARGIELARMLAPSFTVHSDATHYFANPFFTIAVIVVPFALIYSARRGNSPLLAIVISTLTLFPILIRPDNFPIESRYLSPLLPFCYMAVGVLFSDVMKRLALLKRGTGWNWCVTGVLLAFVVAWCLHAWTDLNGYYNFFLARGPNNVTLLRIVEETRGARDIVWIDNGLESGYWLGAGAEVGEALDYLMTLAGTPHQVMKENQSLVDIPPHSVVILTRENYLRWRDAFALELVDAGPPPNEITNVLGAYGVYRVGK